MGGFSKFFIYRPIFAMVIAIVILIVGGLSIPLLPIESTPDITPPTVKVSTSYPGASAEVLAETVAQPIEQEVESLQCCGIVSDLRAGCRARHGSRRHAPGPARRHAWLLPRCSRAAGRAAVRASALAADPCRRAVT